MIRRTTKLFLEIAAIVCAGLAILVVMAAVKLASGPLSVGFITPYIVGALEPEDGSLNVHVGDAVLTWGGWERAIQLRAVNVKVTDPSDNTRAEIPELTIGFSGRALLQAQLAPTSLEVVGPRLTFIRTEEGAFRFGDAPAQPAEAAPSEPAPSEPGLPGPAAPEAAEDPRAQVTSDLAERLMVDILSPPGPANKMGYLTSLSILDADLTLDDRKLNMTWRAPSSTFVLLKGVSGLRLKGTFGFDIGGETAEFALDAEYDTDNEDISAELALADIQPARFASRAPLFESWAGIKLPLSGTLRVRAGFDGAVHDVALDLTGGEGTVSLPGTSADVTVPVHAMRLRGSLTHDLTVAQVDELSLDLDGPKLLVTGTVQGVSQGIIDGPFEVAADLSLNELPTADLKRLWPETVATNAQRWVTANMADGVVQDARISLGGTAGEGGIDGFEVTSLSGGFRFDGVSISYLSPLPAIRKASGSATVHPDRLSFTATGGEVKGLRIGSGKIDITGLDQPDQDLAVEAVVRGQVREVLALLDHPRLGLIKGFGIKPADVGGDTAVRLLVRLPLIDALTFKQVEIAAAANLRGVTMPKAAFDLDVSAGDLTLQLDGRGMDIEGTAVLGEIPVDLVWAENFAPKGFARQFKVKATVDDAGRRSMGLDFDAYLQGPVGIDAVMTQYPNKANNLVLNADLATAVLDLGELGWRKEAGARGTLKAELALTDDKPTAIRTFALDAEGFNATGGLTFAGDGRTVSAVKLDRLAYARSDVSGDVTRRADGGYDIALVGKSLDAGPLLKSDESQAAGGKPAPEAPQADLVPLGIALTLETLHLSEGGSLSHVSARLQRDKKHWRMITVDGEPAQGKTFSLSLLPDGANRRVSARSDDAGGVFKALGISDNIVGGTMQLAALYDDGQPDSPMTGKLEAANFRLIKAPVIAKLLSVALLTGVLDSLRGEGIGFDRLDVPFTMKNDVIETSRAKAHGPALGMTAEGWVNLGNDTIGLRGTLVPAYAVNSILNNIPLIGSLLGGEGSGVFAATYRMTGSLDDPEISVNPLATLAPGFLRGLFGIFEGGVPKQPDALPDPSLEKDVPLPEPLRD